MTRGVEMRDLRLIAAIAQEGSLAGAARQLDYSQPAASQQLAGLEARLGAQLVERGPRGARLTEAGELLARYAAELMERVATVENDVRRRAEHGFSTLRLGTFPSAGAEIAPRVMTALAARGVEVQLLEAEVPELIVALERRQVHAALLFASGGEEAAFAIEGVQLERVLDDEHLVLLPAGHAQAERASVALDDLRAEQWIAAPADTDPSHAALIHACRRRGFEPSFAHRIDSFSITQALVAAGLGVALVPQLAITPVRDDVVVRPLRGTRIVRSVVLAYLTSLGPALRSELLDAVAAVSGP